MLSKELKTRNDFYTYINEDIEFNIFDMSDEEVTVTSLYYKMVKLFQKIKVNFPKRKDNLNIIFNSACQNFERCFNYILIPDNSAANLFLRILTENLIILTFLIRNDSKYTKNWYMWFYNRFKESNIEPEFTKEYNIWFKNFNNDFNKTKDNNIKIDQLLDNNYGWAYPHLKKFINLKHIAENINSPNLINLFNSLSSKIHNNTALQNNTSRFENHTYYIASIASDLIMNYFDVLFKFVFDNKIYLDLFENLYYELKSIIDNFYEKYYSDLINLLNN